MLRIWVMLIALLVLAVSAPTTRAPSKAPSTRSPTRAPTSKAPTLAPTKKPTNSPTTKSPTLAPTTKTPTNAPTKKPTNSPTTKSPTVAPTTKTPTNAPTKKPTKSPTTKSPTTSKPTKSPTKAPTRKPTNPTKAPTRAPTKRPTLSKSFTCGQELRCASCIGGGCYWYETNVSKGCVDSCADTPSPAQCLTKRATCPEFRESTSFCAGYCGVANRKGCSCAQGCKVNCCKDFLFACPTFQ